jgi:hypothetical protein
MVRETRYQVVSALEKTALILNGPHDKAVAFPLAVASPVAAHSSVNLGRRLCLRESGPDSTSHNSTGHDRVPRGSFVDLKEPFQRFK